MCDRVHGKCALIGLLEVILFCDLLVHHRNHGICSLEYLELYGNNNNNNNNNNNIIVDCII